MASCDVGPSFKFIDSSPTNGTHEGLSDALTIWINKPHVVNRRLCGSRILHHSVFKKGTKCRNCVHNILTDLGYKINDLIEYVLRDECSDCRKITECCDKAVITGDTGLLVTSSPSDGNNVSNGADCVTKPESIHNTDVNEINGLKIQIKPNTNTEIVPEINSSLWNTEEKHFSIIIRELLPKQPERHSNMPELIIYDRDSSRCIFIPLVYTQSTQTDQIEVVYEFSLCAGNKNSIQLYVNDIDQSRDSERKLSLTWLKDILLTKLARWSETPNLKTSITSLVLLSVNEYSRLYSELKNKYGLHFAKIWPENTDPQKFVFEDVSIATYLLLLWKQDREKKGLTHKQSFIDLGCGNGLLVHILASEGHPGYGVDIRKRKIWDLYGPETVLKESTVTPSSDCLFPDTDWIIGNHSDELTPWIPVMAARSSYTSCYFVLPCCHFDFNAKFSYDPEFGRPTDGQYQCYLNYIRHVGEESGFIVEEDVLRIPSTKRVCLIGRTRSYDQSREDEMDLSRQAFIDWRCGQVSSSESNNMDSPNSTRKWTQNFTPREKVESVRNCVSVSQCVKDKVINSVFNTILESESCEVKTGYGGKPWRKGGHIPIGGVSDLFDKLTLAELKNECGGLQTLLRNCNQVFQVSSGTVQLRDFTQRDPFEGKKKKGKPSNRDDFHKTSVCWFFTNHPDGCPRQTDNCMYAHGGAELRDKPLRNSKR